jgi:prevent-host-death family protein
VTSTVAQNGFGRLMERVAQDEVVVVTIRNAPRAVLLSSERYEALVAAEAAVLPTLTREFDELFARMQDPAVRAGTRRGFQADGAAMGKAAHAAAHAVAHRRGK